MRLKYGLTASQRKAILRRLRALGVPDPLIGAAFGISRQRVGQLIGRHIDGDEESPRQLALQAAIAGCIRNRETFAEIAKRLGYSANTVRAEAHRHRLNYQLYWHVLRERRSDELEPELREYLKTSRPLTADWINRTTGSTALYTRARRLHTMAYWRQRLGVEKTTLLWQHLVEKE